MSATMSSFLVGMRDESWRPALQQYRKKLLGRKNKKVEKIDDEKVVVVEKTIPSLNKNESEVIVEAVIPHVANEIVEESSATKDFEVHSALQVVRKGVYELSHSCPVPKFKGDEEVMIRNYATGLNPIDWKSVDYNFCLPEFPWVTGREMAGIVEKVAPGVTRFKPGDRVWTSTYYRDSRAGCFQDLVVVPQHTVLPIPGNLAFESAACLGVAALTAAMTLWKWLQVPQGIPKSDASKTERECLLIWGGSTVTGQFAIQIAVQSGLEVIAVTSSKTQALAESLGAHTVVVRDGKTNDEIVELIRAVGGDRITRALDLVGNDTAPFSLQALSKSKHCLFAPLAMMKTQPVPDNVEVLNVEMKQFVNDKSSTIYAEDLNRLVEDGNLRLPDLDVLKGGLSAVEEGLRRLKEGDMGGKKMVVSWAA